VNAALAGESNPKDYVLTQNSAIEPRALNYAWKAWRDYYLFQLKLMCQSASRADRQKIGAAIRRLPKLRQ
jgi:hypothetical protein